jgi:hypothetical protein
MMIPIAVVACNVSERMMADPDMALSRNITPRTRAIRNIIDHGRGLPVIAPVDIQPRAVLVEIIGSDRRCI